MSDHTEECLDLQTRQSLATKLLSGILRPISYVRLEHWALPGQRELSRPELWRD